MPSLEELGFVTTKSGILLFIDTGCMNLWSHDRPPRLPEGILDSDESTDKANASVDYRIVGRDARQAGRMLDLSWHPFYLFDRPRDNQWLLNRLEALKRDHNIDAKIEVLPHRISHRKRVDLALEYGEGAGEIDFHGVWAVATSDAPLGKRLSIVGERMPAPDGDRWRRVTLRCRDGVPIAQSRKVGCVGVDYARILIADVNALGSWEHEKSLDGLADYLFWGLDAEKVARKTKAPRVSESEFGWQDVKEDEVLELAQPVEQLRGKFKFASDYRPHSHHWRVMRTARTNSTESGMTELDGVTVCNFMTTWGDGIFEVHRDLGPEGELVSVRIEMEQT